jgi:hypothetical protein
MYRTTIVSTTSSECTTCLFTLNLIKNEHKKLYTFKIMQKTNIMVLELHTYISQQSNSQMTQVTIFEHC